MTLKSPSRRADRGSGKRPVSRVRCSIKSLTPVLHYRDGVYVSDSSGGVGVARNKQNDATARTKKRYVPYQRKWGKQGRLGGGGSGSDQEREEGGGERE